MRILNYLCRAGPPSANRTSAGIWRWTRPHDLTGFSLEVHSACAIRQVTLSVRVLLSSDSENQLETEKSAHRASNAKVQIRQNGPYMVSGGLPMSKQNHRTNKAGESVKWIAGHAISPSSNVRALPVWAEREETVLRQLARQIEFDGTEPPAANPIKQAKVMQGPTSR